MCESQVCKELIDAEDMNAEWLLQYDFVVCCRCVIEYDMTIKGKNSPLTPKDVREDLGLEDFKPSKSRAMADVNGEI